MCRYGAQCRFQNAEHFSRFNHPDEHPLIQPPLQPQQPPVPSAQMVAPTPQAPQQHPQLHPQQPVLSMPMTMGQTIGDLSDPPSYLVRIGVPRDQADALLVVYPGKPLRAALAFAHQNPSGPVFFLCGSDRHSARDSPRLWEDPDDTNNTCFSIFDLFEGKLGDSKTLTRAFRRPEGLQGFIARIISSLDELHRGAGNTHTLEWAQRSFTQRQVSARVMDGLGLTAPGAHFA